MVPIELGFMRHDLNHPQQGQQLIDWAMAHGVNHFEHCSFYLNWHCEEHMYSLLSKYPRESYYICGKLPVYNVISHRDFKKLFQEQLNKVPGHYFDTYILQAVDDRSSLDIYEQDVIPFFLNEKKKGTIKRFGISIQCLPEVFEKYLNLKCWDVCQMPINYYDWFLCRYDENYALARKYNVPIIAQAPVKGGLLLKDSNIAEGSFAEYGRSNLEATYDFVSQLEGIELILCGNSRLETFEPTFNAITNGRKIPLEKYKAAIDAYVDKSYISCVTCTRCDKVCKERIPISGLFKLYNLALTDKKYFNAFDIMKGSLPNSPGNYCTNCGKCNEVCPMHINIPYEFRHKIFELRT